MRLPHADCQEWGTCMDVIFNVFHFILRLNTTKLQYNKVQMSDSISEEVTSQQLTSFCG